MGKILFLVFLGIPLIEIALFILLGEAVGAVPVLLGVVVTAVIGSLIIKRQGVSLVLEIRQLMAAGQMPARQMAEGVMLAVAGALLLTPGYFTDTLGFLLLVPPVRHWIYDYLKTRVTVVDVGQARRNAQERRGGPLEDPDVIDLDDDDWRSR